MSSRREPGSFVSPPTEGINPVSRGIDRKSSLEIVQIIHEEDRHCQESIGGALKPIARLVECTVEAFRRGGRLIYVGAGTSGRLGVLDAAECPPTFGVDPELVVGIIAGGETALRNSVEGAEDLPSGGAQAVAAQGVDDRDVVCGIASSGATPFVLGALKEALRRGATTALITCNPPRYMEDIGAEDNGDIAGVDVLIELPVGSEVLAGSTRMKGGTATKMVLNMVSTAAMIRFGKVYDNLMVDLRPVNQKLVRRAITLVASVGKVSEEKAARLLSKSGNRVKIAIVMARRDVSGEEAQMLLEGEKGFLRPVIDPPEAGQE